jgi:hypothetical protein
MISLKFISREFFLKLKQYHRRNSLNLFCWKYESWCRKTPITLVHVSWRKKGTIFCPTPRHNAHLISSTPPPPRPPKVPKNQTKREIKRWTYDTLLNKKKTAIAHQNSQYISYFFALKFAPNIRDVLYILLWSFNFWKLCVMSPGNLLE